MTVCIKKVVKINKSMKHIFEFPFEIVDLNISLLLSISL
jgi:hypothetical protein